MTLNGHSPKRLHMGENGEIKSNCSATMHACLILNSTPLLLRIPALKLHSKSIPPAAPSQGATGGKTVHLSPGLSLQS